MFSDFSHKHSAEKLPRRPSVYFEEWDAPLIAGIGWVSQLIEIGGGRDCFSDRSQEPAAKGRIIADPNQVVRVGGLSAELIAATALLLDWLLGEPRSRHPLIGFGRLALSCEQRLYGAAGLAPGARRARGGCATLLLLAPWTAAAATLAEVPYLGTVLGVTVLYLALGHRSLHDHARPVAAALSAGDEAEARRLVGLIVSRDPASLDITRAATESVLENGNDAVFGALFWFAVAGAPGVVVYRLANTLDAMWGYRNARYVDFGFAAARLDDLLNYIPARLTALTYAVLGHTRSAWRCWRAQAHDWDSPNAGPVMAAGAGALGVTLGGPARYAGEWHQRPVLGIGSAPLAADVERALRLVRGGVWLWLASLCLLGALGA